MKNHIYYYNFEIMFCIMDHLDNMSYATKKVFLYKSENANFWKMNSSHQIIVISTKPFKCLDKKHIKWPIK